MVETIKIVRVYSVKRTNHDDLEVDLEVTDYEKVSAGVTSRIPFRYRAGDPYSPLTPVLTQWLADNNPEILPYIPPPELTPEELRALMPSKTPREFRDILTDIGIFPQMVIDKINEIPFAIERQKALNAWEVMTTAIRTDPYINMIGAMFGKTPNDIDTAWLK